MTEELFGKEEPKAAPAVAPNVVDVAARLKILEERYANLVRREQLSEQNMLKFERDLRTEIRALQKRLLESRKHLTEVQERVETVLGQAATAVQKHELRVLDAYLDLWQPTSFVTREEAKRLIDDFRRRGDAPTVMPDASMSGPSMPDASDVQTSSRSSSPRAGTSASSAPPGSISPRQTRRATSGPPQRLPAKTVKKHKNARK